MRQVTSHKLNGLNDALEITARDEPSAGGANHLYHISYQTFDPEYGRTDVERGVPTTAACQIIHFQNGPLAETSVNGISNESLLAIVIDRLQGFQKGDFKCRENAIALTKLEEAMHWLQHRTRERLARGVEGTSIQ